MAEPPPHPRRPLHRVVLPVRPGPPANDVVLTPGPQSPWPAPEGWLSSCLEVKIEGQPTVFQRTNHRGLYCTQNEAQATIRRLASASSAMRPPGFVRSPNSPGLREEEEDGRPVGSRATASVATTSFINTQSDNPPHFSQGEVTGKERMDRSEHRQSTKKKCRSGAPTGACKRVSPDPEKT